LPPSTLRDMDYELAATHLREYLRLAETAQSGRGMTSNVTVAEIWNHSAVINGILAALAPDVTDLGPIGKKVAYPENAELALRRVIDALEMEALAARQMRHALPLDTLDDDVANAASAQWIARKYLLAAAQSAPAGIAPDH
jgi:hypothetical protein